MVLCDPALESLLRSSRLEKGPKNHPLSRLAWGECCGNGYAGPLGPALAAAMSEYVIVDMFADVCVGGKVSERRGLGGGKEIKEVLSITSTA